MDLDEMLETWRTQDKAPIYRVNRDLLHVVLRQEYAKVRYELWWDLWFPQWVVWGVASLFLVLFFTMFSAMTSIGKLTPIAWDYVAAGIAIASIPLSVGAFWVDHRRQSAREAGFGNSLQEKIRRNLSRIDYQLSQYGRLAPSLLMSAPIWTIAILFFWILVRMADGAFSWFLAFFVVWSILSPVGLGRYFKKRLLEHRRRLSQLLDLLNVSE
jgi:hypothetical protein